MHKRFVKAVAVGIIAAGAGQDVSIVAGLQKDDGMDHTVPRVPIAFAVNGAATTTTVTVSTSYITFVPNNMTGDEYRTPPRDPRDYAAFIYPPADRYVYVTGIKAQSPSDSKKENT